MKTCKYSFAGVKSYLSSPAAKTKLSLLTTLTASPDIPHASPLCKETPPVGLAVADQTLAPTVTTAPQAPAVLAVKLIEPELAVSVAPPVAKEACVCIHEPQNEDSVFSKTSAVLWLNTHPLYVSELEEDYKSVPLYLCWSLQMKQS